MTKNTPTILTFAEALRHFKRQVPERVYCPKIGWLSADQYKQRMKDNS